MRIYEIISETETLGMAHVDAEHYLFEPTEVKTALLRTLGKNENQLTRGERGRIEGLFDKPKLNYQDVQRIVRDGWGNDVWTKFTKHIRDRFVK